MSYKGKYINSLVKITEEKALVVSLKDISDECDIDLRSIRSTMKKHKETFLEIGVKVDSVSFKDLKTLSLTEIQASYLMMLMRSSDKVDIFRKRFVAEFFKMKEMIASGSTIPKEFMVMYDKFVPKDGYLEENSQGNVKTKAVRGYFRTDPNSEYGKLISAENKLLRRANGLFQEEIALELAEVRMQKTLIEAQFKQE